jgi:hypothetical protein
MTTPEVAFAIKKYDILIALRNTEGYKNNFVYCGKNRYWFEAVKYDSHANSSAQLHRGSAEKQRQRFGN